MTFDREQQGKRGPRLFCWGEPIARSEEVKKRVDALWRELGL